LTKRIQDSTFTWIGSNLEATAAAIADKSIYTPFVDGVVVNHLKTMKDSRGKTLKVGFIGICIKGKNRDWITYDPDYTAVALKEVAALKNAGADVIIAMTHLPEAIDRMLVANVVDIDLLIGGHEHDNRWFQRGHDFTPLAKADANARTAFAHYITFDFDTKKARVHSHLDRILASRYERDTVVAKVGFITFTFVNHYFPLISFAIVTFLRKRGSIMTF
jgi:5'-nucleotidase